MVIGAPKANTNQPQVVEGGSVFYCPWSLSQSDCHAIEFDEKGERQDVEIVGLLTLCKRCFLLPLLEGLIETV